MTEENILPETGLEQEAVSYSKGCYLGQEVVARIKTYGAVSHALVGLSFEGDELPPSGATLRIGEKEVGEVKSGVRSPTLGAPIALAYLHRNHRASGRRLELEAEGKAQGATVVVLPFYRAVDRSERSARFAEEGMKLFAGDQEQQAIERLREAISVDPKNGDAVEALGVILSRHERYEEAIVLMKELVRVDPDSVMGHTNLSLYFMKLGMREEAEDAQGQALRLSWRMNAERARAERAEAEEQEVARQQLENRLGMFRQVLELDADDPLANLGLGQGLVQLDRFEEGLPFLQKAVEVQPGHSVTYRELGRCLEKLDRIAEAQEVYERGIAVATRRGDLMPLREMERLLGGLRA